LRAVYSASEIVGLDEVLIEAHDIAERLAGDTDDQLARDAFMWRQSQAVAAFALDPRLGALAAELIGAKGIRLIHDVTLDKRREHGPTPWHRDSDFWSFTGVGALTMWIPLQDTPLSMSPLHYASGSHLERNRRPLRRIEKTFIPARFRIASSALTIGDVAVHHYETLHGAPKNREARSRRAFAVHLIDADARFRKSTGDGHMEHSRRCGWDRLGDGDPFPDDIAPLVYRVPSAE
jgi:ectoine hydroxylase-related dioxygenase (phytanoyl-CoA dioxygenase family)